MQVYPFGGTPNYTYVWNTNPPQSTQFTDSTICDTTLGQGTLYMVTITDANGCVITDTVTIVEPYEPVSVIITPDQDICASTSVTSIVLSAQPPSPIYQGRWYLVSGYGVFVPNDTLPTVTVDSLAYGDNVFSWRVWDDSCEAITFVTIRVFEMPVANAGFYPPICEEDEPVRLHADTGYVGIGVWSKLPAASPVTFDNVYDPNTFADNFGWGSNTLVWTITNGPCVADDTVRIIKRIPELCDSTCLEMPTAFSPNGDLTNDHFVVHCIEYSYNRINKFKVFNRWGNMVYSKDNYQNDWYGQTNTGDENGGSPLPDGTYFVILSINKSVRYPEGRILYGYVDLRR
jgi:gliding motility-associated-like protein